MRIFLLVFLVLLSAFHFEWTSVCYAQQKKKIVKRKSSYCEGLYSSDLATATPVARRIENTSRYTFCLRSTVVYQCLYYGPEGKVLRRKETVTQHGTAFSFRYLGGHTYFLTNEHVSEWPLVTTAETKVDGVPIGCKRIGQTALIVDNDKDSYGKDDIQLNRVVIDPELDVAILKAPFKVDIIPFTLGQSVAIEAGDAVLVRGFPLGAFQTVNTGKVTNSYDHDQEGIWDHVDFVFDARLSSGNSGSPILAISCKTGQFELVGIYHAEYREGQSLNVAVGIDQFRELVTTLKPRQTKASKEEPLTENDRQQIVGFIKKENALPFFSFGGHIVGVRIVDHRLVYDVYSKGFPLADWKLAIIEDLKAEKTFGQIGRIWFGNEDGLVEKEFGTLSIDDQQLVSKTVELFRRHLELSFQHRKYGPMAKRSRAAYEKFRTIEHAINKQKVGCRRQIRELLDLVRRYIPEENTEGLPVSATEKKFKTHATHCIDGNFSFF